MARTETPRLFSALLKHWRHRHGLSQLQLALAADVSARHLSFLETGRAKPSREMVLRLAATLGVPLREQNQLLHAAGFPDEFPEPDFAQELPTSIKQALFRMIAQHEPYPLLVMNRLYDVLAISQGAARLLQRLIRDPSALPVPPTPLNLFHALFDPRLLRPAVIDWQRSARTFLSRLHRQALARTEDTALAELVQAMLRYPDVPTSFRQPDFSEPSDPTLTVRLRVGAHELSFFATMTMFNAPQNITLEEICIESYFPVDETTARVCAELADSG